MKRAAATLGLIAMFVALLGGSADAATVAARYQLRGHLPELGERPTLRVFVTQAQYDTYRNSLGDANVFPASSSLFMSFDKDILALYTRGNDTGGRCIRNQNSATLSGNTPSAAAASQSPARRAPSTTHPPLFLLALSRPPARG